jgi:nitrile hydratase beta subunit
MNGVHDMGGMHGMGPIQAQKNEPVFHEPWEGRAYAVTRAMGAWRKWNLDASRFQRELIPPADYFRMSYYERWIVALVELMLKTGLVTRAELESGKPDQGSAKQSPPLTAEKVPILVSKGIPASRDVPAAVRFQAGERVRARNMHPVGHTRLPRYARGKTGTIDRDHGVFLFPDTNALFLGEKPQHVYSVRFAARELWGEQAAPQDSVYVDLWDDYLEPA